jgi:hypothetical protein
MAFRKLETAVATGMLKNSRLACFMAFFGGGDHDLKPVQPAPMPVKLASTRLFHEWTRMTPQKLPNYHRALFNALFQILFWTPVLLFRQSRAASKRESTAMV